MKSILYVRITSILDGISWVLLSCVAMPYRLFTEDGSLVTIMGRSHGALFTFLCIALAIAFFFTKKLSFKWSVIVFIASLIPFAPFFLDKPLKKQQLAREKEST